MIDTCSLCLYRTKLTFEHVPPKRTFNSRPAVAHTIYGLRVGTEHKKAPTLLEAHQGLGRRALCEACNGKTADWYGDAFAEWTTQCLQFAERLDAAVVPLVSFNIEPLSVLKQILVMVLAASGCKAGGDKVDLLRAFVQEKDRVHLPHEFAVKAYFNPNDPSRTHKPLLTQNRLAESCAVLDVSTGTSVFVLGEVAFPPMGYVVYAVPGDQAVSPDFASLCDLRSFGSIAYGQRRTPSLHIPVRRPFGPLPGYYPKLGHGEVKYIADDRVLLMAANRRSS